MIAHLGWSANLEIDKGVPFIEGKIAAKGLIMEGWFLVDTGSETTILFTDKDLLSLAGSEGSPFLVNDVSSRSEAVFLGLDRLEFGGQCIDNPSVVMYTNKTLPETRHVLGVIGLDVLEKRSFSISLTEQTIEFTTPEDLLQWEPCKDFQRAGDGHHDWTLPSKYGIYSTVFRIDTGSFQNVVPFDQATMTAMMEPRLWQSSFDQSNQPILFGVEAMPEIEGRSFGMGLSIASSTLSYVFTIGTQVLSAWDWYFDQPTTRLYCRPVLESQHALFRSKWNQSFFARVPGFSMNGQTNEVKVTYRWGDWVPVLPGVKVGDILVSIDGISLEEIEDRGTALISKLEKGTFVFRRGESLFSVEVKADEVQIAYGQYFPEF